MRLESDEKDLLKSLERGEWKSVGGRKGQHARYVQHARTALRKDPRLDIRLLSKNLEAMSGERITPRLLNMRQAASYLGCSFWTVRDYVRQGLIRVVEMPPLRPREGERQRRALRRVLIDRSDLDAFVESRKRR
jgi:hypothetical protein